MSVCEMGGCVCLCVRWEGVCVTVCEMGGCVCVSVFVLIVVLLSFRLIGWGQIRRGVVYKPPSTSEGGTT